MSTTSWSGPEGITVQRARLPDGVAHPHPALDGDHIRRPLEGRRRRPARLAGAADGLEEMLEAGGRDHPEHDQFLGSLVDDLVLGVVAEEAGRPRHEVVALAIDHHPAPAAEADLELDLVVVGVLAAAPA